MGVLDPVVLGFGAGRVAGQASPLPEMLETFGPTGQDLVDIGLVAGVEDDRIVRRVEDSVNAQGEFDDAKVRAQVPTGATDPVDEEAADLGCEACQLAARERSQVTRATDLGEQGHGGQSRGSLNERTPCSVTAPDRVATSSRPRFVHARPQR